MNRVDAGRMIQRRAAELGMRIKIGCHTFPATGITAYLEAGDTLEYAQLIQGEFPRLCRGGSSSLTFPGVFSGHPSMKLRFVSRQSTRTMEFHRWTSSRA